MNPSTKITLRAQKKSEAKSTTLVEEEIKATTSKIGASSNSLSKDDGKSITAPMIKKMRAKKLPVATRASLARKIYIRNHRSNLSDKQELSTARSVKTLKSKKSSASLISEKSKPTKVNTNNITPFARGKSANEIFSKTQEVLSLSGALIVFKQSTLPEVIVARDGKKTPLRTPRNIESGTATVRKVNLKPLKPLGRSKSIASSDSQVTSTTNKSQVSKLLSHEGSIKSEKTVILATSRELTLDTTEGTNLLKTPRKQSKSLKEITMESPRSATYIAQSKDKKISSDEISKDVRKIKKPVPTPRKIFDKVVSPRKNKAKTQKDESKTSIETNVPVFKSSGESYSEVGGALDLHKIKKPVPTPRKIFDKVVSPRTNKAKTQKDESKTSIETNVPVFKSFGESYSEIGGELDLEQKSTLDLKEIHTRINKVTDACITITRKNYGKDFDMFLSIMEKKETLEKLNLFTELVGKFCDQNSYQKKNSKELRNEVKEWKVQNILLGEQVKHYQRCLKESVAENAQEIHARDEEIAELKKHLVEVKAESENCQSKLIEKIYQINKMKQEYKLQKQETERLKYKIQHLDKQCVEDIETKAKIDLMKAQIKDCEYSLQMKNDECEESKTIVQNYMQQLEKLKSDASQALEQRKRGTEKIEALEMEVEELKTQLDEMNSNKNNIVEVVPENIEKELKRYKQSEEAKHPEIDNWLQSLAETHRTIDRLEESNRHLQNLINVQAQHINTLERNSNYQRTEITDLICKMEEQDKTISELNNELRSKTEEFQTMFSTLGQKQMDLTKQTKTICLLKESYEKSQHSLKMHEERIEGLQEEVVRLRRSNSYTDCFEERRKRSKKTIIVKKYT